jgi:pyrroline-5-carboxylate reductase
MTRIGILGFGSMGRMLAEGLVGNGTISEKDLYISSRNKDKVDDFLGAHPAVRFVTACDELTKLCEIIFICVPPAQVRPVLEELRLGLDNKKHLVSMAANVSLSNIASVVSCPVTRMIPSFVSQVNEGVFLTCHNARVREENKLDLTRLLGSLGVIKEIREAQFEVYTDVTSCSPGFFSAIFSEFIKAASRHGDIDESDATGMFVQTLYGLAKLYKNNSVSFEETMSRVARKGGITEVAIGVVQERLPSVFDELFEKTLARHEEKKRIIDMEYSNRG